MTVGNFNPVVGTQLKDLFSDNLEGNDLEIVYGLRGNDGLSTNEDLTSDESVVLLGGDGDDQYLVRSDSFAVILETGNSDGDTVSASGYKINGNNTYSLTIDDRHLYTADLDTNTFALILDWRSNTVIDNFVLADENFSFEQATAFFDDLAASGDENFLGNLTWDEVQTNSLLVDNNAELNLPELGLSSANINGDIDKVKETEANFQNTIEIAESEDDIDGELTTEDNSYIYDDAKYYYDFYSIGDLTEGLEPGDIVDLNLSSDNFEPILMVLDSRGNVLETDTDGDLTFVVGSGEPFSVSVESRAASSTGSYDLSVDVFSNLTDVSSASPDELDRAIFKINSFETIQTSDSLTGSLSETDNLNEIELFGDEPFTAFEDRYLLIDGNVGEQVRVSLQSDDFDGAIRVQEIDSTGRGEFITESRANTVSGIGTAETATFTIGADANYTIDITSAAANASEPILGDYTLTTEVI